MTMPPGPTPDPRPRDALRDGCALIVPGFAEAALADELRAVADWCAENDARHDRYGDGGVVEAFEARVAQRLGKPAAVVMPSGIMAQAIAVRIWTERARLARFGLHPTSHLAHHEAEGHAALLHAHAVPVGDRLRPMTAADLAAVAQPLACLLVELPIREAGGCLPDWDQLEALKQACRDRALPLHMDGARLWECAAFYGRTHAGIAAGFDSVYVSLYKGLGSWAGAVLAGDAAFVAEARLWRKRLGGTLHHLAPLVAPAAMRFEARLAMMPALYERTLAFAAGLSTHAAFRVNPATPQVNMLHLYLAAPADVAAEARDELARAEGAWLFGAPRAAEVPGWCVAEIYVGDRLLQADLPRVLALYARLGDRLLAHR